MCIAALDEELEPVDEAAAEEPEAALEPDADADADFDADAAAESEVIASAITCQRAEN